MRSPLSKRPKLRNALILLLAFSLLQYVTKGEVTWPADTFNKIADTLGGYATRPEAGWRRATKSLEKMGEAREGHPTPDFDLTGRVVRVADGDTVSVLDKSNTQHKVRLFGIDTPERDQPHGKAARKALSAIVAGKNVGVVVVDLPLEERGVDVPAAGESVHLVRQLGDASSRDEVWAVVDELLDLLAVSLKEPQHEREHLLLAYRLVELRARDRELFVGDLPVHHLPRVLFLLLANAIDEHQGVVRAHQWRVDEPAALVVNLQRRLRRDQAQTMVGEERLPVSNTRRVVPHFF